MAALSRRSCIACRAVRPKAELIRVHPGPGAALSVDLDSGPGRGAYVCPRRSCLEQAVKRGEFPRSLRMALAPIKVEALEWLIRERAFRKVASLLGLARRARKVVSGAEAVESALKRRTARLVLTAADASISSVARVRALAVEARTACRPGLVKEELGAAVGAAPRACVAVTDAHFAEAVMSVLAKIPNGAEAGGGPHGEAFDPLGRASEGVEVIRRGND